MTEEQETRIRRRMQQLVADIDGEAKAARRVGELEMTISFLVETQASLLMRMRELEVRLAWLEKGR